MPERSPRRRGVPGWAPITGEILLALASVGLVLIPNQNTPLVLRLLACPAVVAVLLLRLRLPGAALIAGSALFTLTSGGFLLQVAVSYRAGYRVRPLRRSLLLMAAAYLTQVVGAWRPGLAPAEYAVRALGYGLAFSLLGVMPWLLGRYQAQRRRLIDALRERNLRLERERLLVTAQTRMRERTRIARDMHDSLGHQLTLIALQTGALEVDRGLGEQQREVARQVRTTAQQAMDELRNVIGVLRHVDPDAPAVPAQGLAQLDELVEGARRVGARVTAECLGPARPVAPVADHAAFRVVQEALTNACRYAPGAPVAVTVRYEPDGLLVEVVNDPPAGPAPSTDGGTGGGTGGGMGLVGLRERVRVAGGMLHTGRTEDGGFRVAAVLAYSPPAGEPASDDAAADDPAHPVPAADDPAQPAPVADVDASDRSAWVVLVVVAAVVVGLVALVLVVPGGLLWYGDDGHEPTAVAAGMPVTRAEYDALRPGQDRLDVAGRMAGKLQYLARPTVGGPVPAGADCEVYGFDEKSSDGGGFRVCFVAGKLVQKRELDARTLAEAGGADLSD